MEQAIDVECVQTVVDAADRAIDTTVDGAIALLKHDELQQIVSQSIESIQAYQRAKDNFEEGFNIFRLVSQRYYHENFHSDVLQSLLQFNHNQFLPHFIDMLNRKQVGVTNSNEPRAGDSGRTLNIERGDFSTLSTVERESGRIDVLIYNDISKKAIIIENKLNDAGDRPAQIPRYYQWAIDRDFDVVAVVYIVRHKDKTPDQSSWTGKYTEHKRTINEKLIILPGFDDGTGDLAQWIDTCLPVCKNIHVISTLQQYRILLEYLRGEEMNDIVMKRFYEQISSSGIKSEQLSATKQLIDELPKYIANMILEEYRNSEFGQLFTRHVIYQQTAVFDKLDKIINIDNHTVHSLFIDIQVCNFDDSYSCNISVSNRDKIDGETFGALMKQLHIEKETDMVFDRGGWSRYLYKIKRQKTLADELKELRDYLMNRLCPWLKKLCT